MHACRSTLEDPTNGWKPGPEWTRKVVVPRTKEAHSRPGESPRVRREELISGGVTLGRMPNSPAKAELIALAARHFAVQLVGEGPVHSDVSPGNLMATPDGRLAILDRGMYLKLLPAEKELLIRLAFADDAGTRARLLVSSLRNPDTDDEVILKEVSEAFKSGEPDDPEDSTVKVLTVLHQQGVRVPLRLMLVFKNLNVLHRMAKEAGFEGGLKGALAYSPAGTSGNGPAGSSGERSTGGSGSGQVTRAHSSLHPERDDEEKAAEAVAAAFARLRAAPEGGPLPPELARDLAVLTSQITGLGSVESILEPKSNSKPDAAGPAFDPEAFKSALARQFREKFPDGLSESEAGWLATQALLGARGTEELPAGLSSALEGDAAFLAAVVDPAADSLPFARRIVESAEKPRRDEGRLTVLFIVHKPLTAGQVQRIEALGKESMEVLVEASAGLLRDIPGTERRALDVRRLDAILTARTKSQGFSSHGVILPKALVGDLSDLGALPSDSILRRAAVILIDAALRAAPPLSLSDLERLHQAARLIAQQA